MRVVDTSAWIEWFLDSATGRSLDAEWPERDKCIVPTIVQLELTKWLTREVSEDAADLVIALTQKCIVAPLDTTIALRAAAVARDSKLATADAIVYATALERGAGLLTCDAHFNGLRGVVYRAKGTEST
ncbi:MAG: type II toxin-antitoxin system VapC family toxin [Methylobacteriaceae bacterium]|nr:type II toxin-antitoxin system VapC family toxin [Methylobacteriaceae bacterium]